MDADTTEGLPSTEELADNLPGDMNAADVVSSAPPAPPVDAASLEPAPQTLASAESSEPSTTSVSAEPKSPEISASSERAVASEKVNAVTATSLSHMSDSPRVDVSAATVARMMGIASTSDLRVLEGRVDLLTSKVSAILTKMDRCLSMFSSIPTASDIGRLEVQVAAVKSMMKELLDSVGAPVSAGKEQTDRIAAQEQSRKLREGIKTNTES
jgi:hypothetical protein